MAASVTSPIVLEAFPVVGRRNEWGFGILLTGGLTALAVAVHGYHPYAEDGGLYMAGVKRLIDPALYPHETAFVTEHLRFSVFAPAVAGLVRWSHLRLDLAFLLLYVASFWVTLFAAWLLAKRCFTSRTARCGAVTLLAAWMTLPIAGTALMLMDPYVTARSISTPCALLALVGALMFLRPEGGEGKRGLLLACGALTVAAVMHPLMAADALGCILLLGCVSSASGRVRRWATMTLCVAAVFAAGVLWSLSPAEGALYRRAAETRHYWFLSQWQWYELIGLAAPLMILAAVALSRRRRDITARVALSRMAIAAGITAVVVAVLFARLGAANYVVARLQPLRVFQLIYVVMILMLGAAGAERVLKQRPARWAAALTLLCGVMVFADRQTFPDSPHLELPHVLFPGASENLWEQAFLWIRQNTPKDALFALDANYISKPGEDAQCFRAIAERSALPDYSKDGGEVSIAPRLAPAWAAGQAAQARLSAETDAQRERSLGPLGVTWVVLDRTAVTDFACGYMNGAVKVCRLPQEVADGALH